MFKKNWKIIFAVLVALIIILIIRDSRGFDWRNFNYTKDTTTLETVNIGFIGSLTGPASLAGIQALAAAQLAVDEINADGGIQGKTLRFFVEDGLCSKEGGEEAIKKLMKHDIVGLVGGLCSSASEGLIDSIEQYEIPTISYCSSSTTLSGVSDYFFRIYPSDDFQGLYAADYIKNSLNIDTIAVLYVDDVWGNSLKDVFSESFEAQGGIIAHEYAFDLAEKDFTMWDDIIDDSSIELVYFLGFDDATKRALDILGNRGDFILFGANTWNDEEIWNDVLRDKNILYSAIDVGKYSALFEKKIQNRGIYHLSSCTPHAYDAVHVLTQALEKHSDDTSALLDYLRDVRYVTGISKSVIQFNGEGDVADVGYIIKNVYKK